MSIVLFNSGSNSSSSVTFETGYWEDTADLSDGYYQLVVGFGPPSLDYGPSEEVEDSPSLSSNFINYEITEAVVGAATFQLMKFSVVGTTAPQGLRILDENSVELYDSSTTSYAATMPAVWSYGGNNTWIFGVNSGAAGEGINGSEHWIDILEAMIGRPWRWDEVPPSVDVSVTLGLYAGKQRTVVVY
jgi:hypothetical protein